MCAEALPLEVTVTVTPPHECHIPYCHTHCAPDLLMCWSHWAMVPDRMQRAVWEAWVADRCLLAAPTRAYTLAARAAIKHVIIHDELPA